MEKLKKKPSYSILNGQDFHYTVDTDYSYEYDCENEGCNSEGICRCGHIVDATVKNVDLSKIAKKLISRWMSIHTDITEYCIERILRISGIDNPCHWEVGTEWGYYGQEIKDVRILPNDVVDLQLEELFSLNDNNKILHVLKIEYGTILPKLKNRTWAVETISKEQLVYPQTDYLLKVKQQDISKYKNWKLPLGIVIPNGKKFSLIDGYHRCLASKGQSSIQVIVGRK